jgi:serine/threonine protein phosphatase PrpC
MIVFDGHGNDLVAKFSQLYFKDVLRNELYGNQNIMLTKQESKIPINVALHKACEKINDSIPFDMGLNSGCAALIILQNAVHLWVANIGDCRALMNRGDEAIQLSVDHKPSLQSEHDRIVKAGGFVQIDSFGTPRVNGNLALSRSFGDFYLSPSVTWVPDIFLFPIDKTENNFVFMASDGVYDTVQNNEIVTIIKEHTLNQSGEAYVQNIGKACAQILDLARKRGSGDNITIIVSDIL